jgi:hypothetical protein
VFASKSLLWSWMPVSDDKSTKVIWLVDSPHDVGARTAPKSVVSHTDAWSSSPVIKLYRDRAEILCGLSAMH